MELKNGYSGLQISLHWATAALIAGNYFVSEGMQDAFDAKMSGGAFDGFVPRYHVWAGATLLAVVVMRLIVRGFAGAPQDAKTGLAAVAQLVLLPPD